LTFGGGEQITAESKMRGENVSLRLSFIRNHWYTL